MSWLQTAKDVAELVQKLDNIDLLRKVMTLQTELMEMQDQIFKLREETLNCDTSTTSVKTSPTITQPAGITYNATDEQTGHSAPHAGTIGGS